MSAPLSRHPHPFAVAILLAILAGYLNGCTPNATEELAHYVPGLPDRWIEALTARDESTFEDFARAEGAGYLLLVETHLDHQLDTTSLEAFQASYTVLVPALTRVSKVLAEDFGFEKARQVHQRFVALSLENAFTCVRLFDEAYVISNSTELDNDQKIRAIRAILEQLDRLDAPIATAHLWLRVAELHGGLGERVAQREALEQCIARGPYTGSHRMTCQALGVLGTLVGDQGDVDAMLHYWNRGLELAKQHRLPEQSGRLTTFFANYYENMGSLALARELRREANDLNLRYGGTPAGVRFLEDWLTLNADLGCWDIVQRDLRRSELLLARFTAWSSSELARERSARLDHIRARALMAQGQVEEAQLIWREVEDELSDIGYISLLSGIQLSRARALLEHGNAREAKEVLDRSLLVAREYETRAGLLVEAAAASAMLSQWDSCEKRLLEFEELTGDRRGSLHVGWTLHDALRIRLALRSRDNDAIIEAVDFACRELDLQLRSHDAISEGHLALRETQVLNDVLHEILASNPELSYRLELAWRCVPSLLGADTRTGQPSSPRCNSPLQACEDLILEALEPGTDSGAGACLASASTHKLDSQSRNEHRLLYRISRNSLERWSVADGELRHATLEISEGELRSRVKSILQQMEQPPVTGPGGENAAELLPPELRTELHSLARILLPEVIFENARAFEAGAVNRQALEPYPVLLIYPDGALNALPFGVLNLLEDRYLPLITRYDPVYRGSGGPRDPLDHTAAPSSPGVIVADPILSPSTATGGARLPRLDHGTAEARALHAWTPSSVLLEGRGATKSALLDAWEEAPFLYFACHVVRDADAPYISYLPLSPSAELSGHAFATVSAFLEARDIHLAYLRGRPLVVLAACSSGTPYLVHGAQAPGLGESFLEAGASTVIQTYWSVRDDVAARLMKDTMHAWAVDGVAPEHALNSARRWMARNGEFTHPYYWGSAVVMRSMPGW